MSMVITFIILSSLLTSAAAEVDAKCLSLRCPKESVFTYNITLKQKLCTEEFPSDQKNALSFVANVTCVADNYLSLYGTRGLKYQVDLSLAATLDAKDQSEKLPKQFGNPFFFVQLSNGTVIHVLHIHDDDSEVVNFKKSIASLFQTSLCKGDHDIVETDANSRRKVHYTVVEIANGRLSISKRSGSLEMEKLFAGFDAKPSEFEYNENQVTILSQKSTMPTRITGVLQTSLHQRRQTSARESLPSNRIRIEQTFSARLIKCLELRQKRSAQFFSVEDTHGLQVSSVEGKQTKAEGIKRKLDRQYLELSQLLKSLQENSSYDNWESLSSLVELEGLCEQYLCSSHRQTPATDVVIKAFLTNVSKRKRLFPLLITSGTSKAQQVIAQLLGDPLGSGLSVRFLFSSVAFLRNPSDQLLTQIMRLVYDNDDAHKEEATLSLGALARNLGEPASDKVLRFLLSRFLASSADSDAVVLLLALGNAGKMQAVESIVGVLERAKTSKAVRDAAILALNHIAEVNQTYVDDFLQSRLEEGRNISQTCAQDILDVLRNRLWSDEVFSQSRSELEEAVVAALKRGRRPTEIYNSYVKARTNKRVRREGSSDWAYNSPLFNTIASESERQYEKQHYKSHASYLYGTTLGSSSTGLNVVAGVFAGVNLPEANAGPFGFVFAKAVATVNIFGSNIPIIDAFVSVTGNEKSAELKRFIRFGSITLIPYSDETFSLCRGGSFDIEDRTHQLVSRQFELPLKLGLKASLQVSSKVTYGSTLGYEVCPLSSPIVSGLFKPSVTLSSYAKAELSFLSSVATFGLKVNISIPFYVEPVVMLKRRQTSLGACLNFYVGSAGNGRVYVAPYYSYDVLVKSGGATLNTLTVDFPIEKQDKKLFEGCKFFG